MSTISSLIRRATGIFVAIYSKTIKHSVDIWYRQKTLILDALRRSAYSAIYVAKVQAAYIAYLKVLLKIVTNSGAVCSGLLAALRQVEVPANKGYRNGRGNACIILRYSSLKRGAVRKGHVNATNRQNEPVWYGCCRFCVTNVSPTSCINY